MSEYYVFTSPSSACKTWYIFTCAVIGPFICTSCIWLYSLFYFFFSWSWFAAAHVPSQVFFKLFILHTVFSTKGVMVCGCFRAGRRVSKLTHGRMLTTTSLRSPTASASCSKLPDLKLRSFLKVVWILRKHLRMYLCHTFSLSFPFLFQLSILA